MPSTTAPWQSEFREDYAVPGVITENIPDQSWHNDACPSFGVYAEGDSLSLDCKIWCEHPDPAQRESGADGFRFYVQCYSWDETTDALLASLGIHDEAASGGWGFGTNVAGIAVDEYNRRKTLLEGQGVVWRT